MSKPGLYANIHAKKERIKAGSGETMRKVGTKGAPTNQAFTNSANTSGGFHQAQKTAKATGQKMTMRKGGKVKKRR